MNFDMAQFDSYREDNRREVKRRGAAFQTRYGRHILLLLTAMAESLFLV